jgi:hypothetical protein
MPNAINNRGFISDNTFFIVDRGLPGDGCCFWILKVYRCQYSVFLHPFRAYCISVFPKQFTKALELRGFYSGFIGKLLGPQPACGPFKGCHHNTQIYFNFHKGE